MGRDRVAPVRKTIHPKPPVLQRGDRALVVVSGGLDSMVLLHVFHQLATGTGGN